MRRTLLLFVFELLWLSSFSQTVVTDTSYATTVLECQSNYVAFPDGTRYFSGMVVKQGSREYYLNSPYTVEVLGNTIVFDDPDSYTDKVSVNLARTYYADMDTFKIAAVACITGGGAGGDTTITVGIDSISYYGDSLYVYAGGNPVPWTTYIDSCPCEEPPPPSTIPIVMGNPDVGEAWGNPSTGQVWGWEN